MPPALPALAAFSLCGRFLHPGSPVCARSARVPVRSSGQPKHRMKNETLHSHARSRLPHCRHLLACRRAAPVRRTHSEPGTEPAGSRRPDALRGHGRAVQQAGAALCAARACRRGPDGALQPAGLFRHAPGHRGLAGTAQDRGRTGRAAQGAGQRRYPADLVPPRRTGQAGAGLGVAAAAPSAAVAGAHRRQRGSPGRT
jgi:hypothetical protein